jgi:hypothetical protein
MTKTKGGASWLDMPADEFARRIEKAKQAAALFASTIHELFPGLVTLSAEERASAQRMHQGEDAVLLSVLDLIDAQPAMFQSLADEDEGHDPNRYETKLQRERITKWQGLASLQQVLKPCGELIDDSMLFVANLFRPSLRAAIQIAKPVAKRDSAVQTLLAPALDFLSAPAKKAAETRREHAQAK